MIYLLAEASGLEMPLAVAGDICEMARICGYKNDNSIYKVIKKKQTTRKFNGIPAKIYKINEGYEQYGNSTICHRCGKEIFGRANKRFCDQLCYQRFRTSGSLPGVKIPRDSMIEKKKPKKFDQLAKVEAKARKSGRTYGEMVAMERLRVANDKRG